MGKKIGLFVDIGISILLIIILSIYTVMEKPECRRVHIDDINRAEEIKYLDEQMAREIADVVLGIQTEQGKEGDANYDVEIVFDVHSYEWVVSYVPPKLQSDDEIFQGKMVRIRKDNGIITVYDQK